MDTLSITLLLNWKELNYIQAFFETMQSSHENFKTGQRSYKGGIRNLSVTINDSMIKIHGSLSKFFHGNNVESLTAETTKLAIEELSDITSLPIKDAMINRLDFAQNLCVKHPPTFYYDYFGESPRKDRLEQGTGLYYRNTISELVVYDKGPEAKKIKDLVDPEIAIHNLMRIETRRYGHQYLCRHFKVPELKVDKLCEPAFYRGLVTDWAAEYNKIDKYSDVPVFDDSVYQEPKKMCNQLMYDGIQSRGGFNTVMSLVKQAKKRDAYKTNDQYHAQIRNLRRLSKIANNSLPNTFVEEIDNKVMDIVNCSE